MNELSVILDIEYFKIVDMLESYELKLLLDEMFLISEINLISYNELTSIMSKISNIELSDIDKKIFEIIFKTYASYHYAHKDYGFIIFLNLLKIIREPNTINKSGFVYICSSDIKRFKIGASKNPEQRVKDLGLGSSIKHTLLFKIKTNDMFKFEKLLHERYSSKNIHSEWFNLSTEDLQCIRNLSLADMV